MINSRRFQDEKQKKTTKQAFTEILHKFNKGQIDIPVLSKIVQETENVIRKPNSSAKDLAKVIERDAAISIKLVSVANSPIYRGAEVIHVVSQAISRVGLRETQSIVLAIATKNLYRTDNNQLMILMEKMWLHSLACAHSSRSIAQKLRLADVERLFLMGLIHDIGKVLLVKALTDAVSQIESLNIDDFISGIQEIHCSFGATVLERWKFGRDFIQIAKLHDKSKYFQTSKKEVLVVNLANKLTRKIGYSIFPDEEIELSELESAKLLGIDATSLDTIVKELETFMESAETIF